VENHVFLFSIFWWAEPDDPIYTDGCVEYSEAIDFIDGPESIIQETAWNLFKEIRTVIHQYAPRFCITNTCGRDSSPAHTQPKGQPQ
jgi:hypothetical protein